MGHLLEKTENNHQSDATLLSRTCENTWVAPLGRWRPCKVQCRLSLFGKLSRGTPPPWLADFCYFLWWCDIRFWFLAWMHSRSEISSSQSLYGLRCIMYRLSSALAPHLASCINQGSGFPFGHFHLLGACNRSCGCSTDLLNVAFIPSFVDFIMSRLRFAS